MKHSPKLRTCMPVIPLVPSDSLTLISSLLRLSAHHLALAASALQPLKSGTLSLHLYVPVPVLTPFIVTSRPTTASRPSDNLAPLLLRLTIGFCWPLCVWRTYISLTCLKYTWRSTAGLSQWLSSNVYIMIPSLATVLMLVIIWSTSNDSIKVPVLHKWFNTPVCILIVSEVLMAVVQSI